PTPSPPLTPSSSLHCSPLHRHLPSFPTRRSSDLGSGHLADGQGRVIGPEDATIFGLGVAVSDAVAVRLAERPAVAQPRRPGEDRSEEHTSELQSLTNLVCRLLLEKKNRTDTNSTS